MSVTALVVIDMLNPYDHEDGDLLAAEAEKIAEPLHGLIERARDHDEVRVVYVNDNFGDFSASRQDLVDRALKGRRPDIVKPIVPPPDATFLTKVRHSVFYGTPLEYLLQRIDAERLILTGQVTEQCVLYSALDAYVRHFPIMIPRDAVACIDPELGDAALRMMERNMRADIVTTAECLR
ncbi:cysteine hydrolase family protein [Actinoallomurus iriomotensis]|uniref:Isochorismatase n=1 Tax=Actinoallomurus iriomotensis TaxID=478107 RepID=A0A9W6VZF4_9ACTN|nr:isochorismatase family cysteine hydrolase [Actinoallomurus iriomotensis]GLY85835.1 isochorismatase [Actinoallomurus iriomotensis]